MMHGHGESDSAIVAGKPTNKAERSAAGEDPADRVRSLCGGKPPTARTRQTGDLQLLGLHLHLRQNPPG